MGSKTTSIYSETLTLLKLWALGGKEIKKSSLGLKETENEILNSLEKSGSITIQEKRRNSKVLSLTDSGLKKLTENMTSHSLVCSSRQVGAKTVNAILEWFRTQEVQTTKVVSTNGKTKKDGIESYQEFLKIFLETYEQLNRDYNLSNLVPIYRIRKEINGQVSRAQFNDWLLEIQANDLIQLMGGELSGSTAEQREDSVSIPGGGLRFYVKRL